MDKDPFDVFEIQHGKRFKTEDVQLFSIVSNIAHSIENKIEHLADKIGLKQKHRVIYNSQLLFLI